MEYAIPIAQPMQEEKKIIGLQVPLAPGIIVQFLEQGRCL
jgi:hypothetical protein